MNFSISDTIKKLNAEIFMEIFYWELFGYCRYKILHSFMIRWIRFKERKREDIKL